VSLFSPLLESNKMLGSRTLRSARSNRFPVACVPNRVSEAKSLTSRIRAGRWALVVVLAAWLAGCADGPRSAADCGRHYAGGGSGLLGLLAAAGAFDRPAGPDCRQPTSARGSTPAVVGGEGEGESIQSGSMVTAPNAGGGQTVYSPSECIGPIVMGVCHGAILPHSATHPTCYGQMINGICTGPMF